jgi:hypothetical protein
MEKMKLIIPDFKFKEKLFDGELSEIEALYAYKGVNEEEEK